MINVDYCGICGSTNITKFFSGMHDFVTRRMLKNSTPLDPPIPCSLIVCLNCEGRTSSYRFNADEEKGYYFQYMKEDYLKDRTGIDGTAAYYASEENKKNRRNAAADVMSKYIQFESIKSVLDFGGDTGEMIPFELSHAKQYVVDQDCRQLDSKVKFVSSPTQLDPVDLVICAHTLEHVSFPKLIIETIKSYIQPGSWFYLEVPNEATWTPDHGFSFHEHINLFTPNTLTKILEFHGFAPTEVTHLPYGGQMSDALAIMGKLI